MKVRALADISGPMGRKSVGEEFVVGATEGKELVDRKLVEAVEDAPVKPTKEPKTEA
ncbi:hypothetical protein [Pseudomonas sp. UBA1879]|uniref:hypothetical protein n=1 Tax=Pseudomonas sp. UBA1879 TaxID=1947305 RepID=UPI0025E49EAC|nr:hypothetical protein [Pseudomonas sp. UBA1879]